MKEWKIRQELYHRLTAHSDRGDDFEQMQIVFEWDEDSIVQRALEYPIFQNENLYYPGKSYAVAIIYAQLLSKHFNENLIELLDDPQLLFGNDPYFKTYSEAKEIYDRILKEFPDLNLSKPAEYSEDMNRTLQYFKEEFMLEEFK
ncbi:MAG: hypothetical protein ACK5V3_11190 [Bdellovibrionales bacterium]